MKEKLVSAVSACIMAIIVALFRGWTYMLTVLTIFIALDIVSGFARAFVQQKLSSKESWAGIMRKLLIFIAVALAAQLDLLLGDKHVMRDAVVLFYCASEGLSVLENLVAAGCPVPDQLRNALKQLNGKKYEH